MLLVTNENMGLCLYMHKMEHRWNKGIHEYMKVNGRMNNLLDRYQKEVIQVSTLKEW